jgi:hypothetical protein
MRTIQAQWIDYRKEVVPVTASAEQIQETRRAFYAGAHAILTMQFAVSGGEEEVSEDAGVALIESWHQECRDFNKIIGKPAEARLP